MSITALANATVYVTRTYPFVANAEVTWERADQVIREDHTVHGDHVIFDVPCDSERDGTALVEAIGRNERTQNRDTLSVDLLEVSFTVDGVCVIILAVPPEAQ